MLIPKLMTTLKSYDRAQFVADLGAGIIVGIVALPLAIAFAIASGVTPDRGLYTAVIAGFLISALGGSRVQIGGPTGAFVVIVYGIVQTLWRGRAHGGDDDGRRHPGGLRPGASGRRRSSSFRTPSSPGSPAASR